MGTTSGLALTLGVYARTKGMVRSDGRGMHAGSGCIAFNKQVRGQSRVVCTEMACGAKDRAPWTVERVRACPYSLWNG